MIEHYHNNRGDSLSLLLLRIIDDGLVMIFFCLSNFTNGEYLFNVGAYDNSISDYKKFINLDLIDIYWHYT